MINQSPEEKLKALDKELVKIGVMEMPAIVLLGLGLYGRFAAKGEAFHPLLNDGTVVNSLLTVGGILLMLSTKKLVTWVRRRKDLLEQINT